MAIIFLTVQLLQMCLLIRKFNFGCLGKVEVCQHSYFWHMQTADICSEKNVPVVDAKIWMKFSLIRPPLNSSHLFLEERLEQAFKWCQVPYDSCPSSQLFYSCVYLGGHILCRFNTIFHALTFVFFHCLVITTMKLCFVDYASMPPSTGKGNSRAGLHLLHQHQGSRLH